MGISRGNPSGNGRYIEALLREVVEGGTTPGNNSRVNGKPKDAAGAYLDRTDPNGSGRRGVKINPGETARRERIQKLLEKQESEA